MVPVLVVATAERLALTHGAAAEVDARYVVDDRTDVRELHVLLGDALASAAWSRRQLTLASCPHHHHPHKHTRQTAVFMNVYIIRLQSQRYMPQQTHVTEEKDT